MKCAICTERLAHVDHFPVCVQCDDSARHAPSDEPATIIWAARRARMFERRRVKRQLDSMRRTIALQGIAMATARRSFTDCEKEGNK